MKSKITGGETTLLFTKKLLNKYDVKYYRCDATGFIQTEQPYWLEEAYATAITRLDVGLIHRNNTLAGKTGKLLAANFDKRGVFLDYAGGYGMFTRLMRDLGFNYYHTDKYCANLFAEYFDLSGLPVPPQFELVSAFEVFEHLNDPLQEIKEIAGFSDNLFFTTELVPQDGTDIRNWWYLSPETGQHIAFYTAEALADIAKQLGRNFYTDGAWLHLFTKKTFNEDILKELRDGFLLRKAKKLIKKMEAGKYGKMVSLLPADGQFIKDKLNAVNKITI